MSSLLRRGHCATVVGGFLFGHFYSSGASRDGTCGSFVVSVDAGPKIGRTCQANGVAERAFGVSTPIAAFGTTACVVALAVFGRWRRGRRPGAGTSLQQPRVGQALFAATRPATVVAASSGDDSAEADAAAWPSEQEWPLMLRGAFTPAECEEIAQVFVDKLTAESDLRQYEAVARLNRFDTGGKLMSDGVFDWIYKRVLQRAVDEIGVERVSGLLPKCCEIDDDMQRAALRFRSLVDFNLMHEFDKNHSFFGWHVDTKPGDGTCRTLNLNVMLSDPVQEFTGGALQVGGHKVAACKGDAYFYPASLPHIVHDLESGTRRTLIVALAEKTAPQSRLQQYWTATEEALDALVVGALKKEPKLHLIRGDFLEAVGRPAEARLAFVEQYKVSPQQKEYADHFYREGVAVLQRKPQNLPQALDLFDFAARVDPLHPGASEAVQKLRAAMEGISAK